MGIGSLWMLIYRNSRQFGFYPNNWAILDLSVLGGCLLATLSPEKPTGDITPREAHRILNSLCR
jgi:hypothetical protein